MKITITTARAMKPIVKLGMGLTHCATLIDPRPGVICPELQEVHFDWPCNGLKRPIAQSVHDVLAELALNVPIGQREKVDAPNEAE